LTFGDDQFVKTIHLLRRPRRKAARHEAIAEANNIGDNASLEYPDDARMRLQPFEQRGLHAYPAADQGELPRARMNGCKTEHGRGVIARHGERIDSIAGVSLFNL
jgi:hypothetical protein